MSGGGALRELDSLIRTVDDSVHDPLGAVIKRQLRSVRVHVAALAQAEATPPSDCPHCRAWHVVDHGWATKPAEAAPPPKHRPEFRDDVPTGWCECGQTYPHIIINAGTPERRETLDVEGVIAELVSVEARLDNARLDVSRTLRTLQGIAAIRTPDTEEEGS